MGRPKKVVAVVQEVAPVAPVVSPQAESNAALVGALVQAIQATKPIEKKNAMNRKALTPWTPKNGEPKLKFKRVMHQHGMLIDPDLVTNEQIDLMNRLKPGRFMDNWVKVTRRRDKGIDIDYPIRTASQRLKLVSTFGIRDLTELLQRCIDEANDPKRYAKPEDEADL